MKYDDASWHYEGDFPADLPPEAGATHIGMFLAWAITNDLVGELHLQESQQSLQQVKKREMIGRDFLMKECDGKLTDEDLNKEGNAFAEFYLDDDTGHYLPDYDQALGRDLPSLYHVEDTWENFDKLASLIDKRFAEWRQRRG